MVQVVNAPPPPSPNTVTIIDTSGSPSYAGDLVTFTSQTFFEGDDPTGAVSFSVQLGSTIVETYATTIDPDGFAFFSTSSLPVGNLFVTAAYAGDSAHIASSGTRLQQVLAPVPEPSAYALMLAGIALLGFAARRRLV